MDVQTLFAKPAIEGFDRGVVRRLPAATEVEDDAVGVRSPVHRGADELGPVVAVDPLWQSALESEPPECGGDILAAESLADVDRETFAGEEIDHRECSESPTVGQLIP